jgi:hypothetical protein
VSEDELLTDAFRPIELDEEVPILVNHGFELGPFYTTNKTCLFPSI